MRGWIPCAGCTNYVTAVDDNGVESESVPSEIINVNGKFAAQVSYG